MWSITIYPASSYYSRPEMPFSRLTLDATERRAYSIFLDFWFLHNCQTVISVTHCTHTAMQHHSAIWLPRPIVGTVAQFAIRMIPNYRALQVKVSMRMRNKGVGDVGTGPNSRTEQNMRQHAHGMFRFHFITRTSSPRTKKHKLMPCTDAHSSQSRAVT